MKKHFIFLPVFVFIVFPLAAETDYSDYTIEEGKYFEVFIEQGGETVNIRNNRVELEKAAFTLVLVMKEPLGILTNFSLEDRLFRGLKRGKPLTDILDEPDLFMGLAEENFNLRKRIFIDEYTPHYLYFQDKDNHRFNEIYMSGEYYICKRTVGYYAFLNAVESAIPVELLSEDTLFVSLLYSDYNENWERMELQKEVLKIDFM
jgi:hypothetical protein